VLSQTDYTIFTRERAIRACTNTSIRVLTMADTDTSTPCHGVPATYSLSLQQAGGLENAAYTQWVAQSIQS